MCDLPDLVLEKLLAHLDLQTLIRCRAVSKRWCVFANGIRVRSLFFSEWTVDHLDNKWQLVAPNFDRNYIECSKFELFFRHYTHSILSRLRHLRLCELDLSIEGRRSAFAEIVNGFGKLECLDLVRVWHLPGSFELRLPNLRSVRFEELKCFDLTLDTPRLSELTCLFGGNVWLDLIHPESVQSLPVYGCGPYVPDLELEKLKNLRFIYIERMSASEIGPNFLVNLARLEEIHLNYDREALEKLQFQRNQHDRTDLRIYFHGLCLDHLKDYEDFWSVSELSAFALDCAITNASKLAARLPLYHYINYSQIEPVVAWVPVDNWTRFSNLGKITVDEPVEYVQQFLSFLRNFDNVHSLNLNAKNIQSVFDQLPEHCPKIQHIRISGSKPALDFSFLLGFKHLLVFDYNGPLDVQIVCKAFEELKFLRSFVFYNDYKMNKMISIYLPKTRTQLQLKIDTQPARTCADLDALVEGLNSIGSDIEPTSSQTSSKRLKS